MKNVMSFKQIFSEEIRPREDFDFDVDELLNKLYAAYSDEWLAYYQYWLGAQICQGPMMTAVIEQLDEHAAEEFAHAEELATRIIQLRGTPPTNPKDWFDLSTCGFTDPVTDPLQLLKDNLEGEQCAIKVYKELLDFTKDLDDVTYNLILGIYEDEVEHEKDLQGLIDYYNSIIGGVETPSATETEEPSEEAPEETEAPEEEA